MPKGFPFELMKELKEGKNVDWEEKEYLVEDYTAEPTAPLSYAFCSDTAYSENESETFSQKHEIAKCNKTAIHFK